MSNALKLGTSLAGQTNNLLKAELVAVRCMSSSSSKSKPSSSRHCGEVNSACPVNPELDFTRKLAPLELKKAYRDCVLLTKPLCNEEDLKKSKCHQKLMSRKKKNNFPFSHLLENPDCCEGCPDPLPRFDDIYYAASDKTRDYQQTWVECPKLLIRPRKVCCYEREELPPLQKRKAPCPPTACAQEVCCETATGPCPKIKVACCRKARKDVKCSSKSRTPAPCKKICTPYPSFSECAKPKLRKPRRTECECMEFPMWCEVYRWAKIIGKEVF